MKFELDVNNDDIERLKFLCNKAGSYKLEKELTVAQIKNSHAEERSASTTLEGATRIIEAPIFPSVSETFLLNLRVAVQNQNRIANDFERRAEDVKKICREVAASTSLPQKEIDFIQAFCKQEISFAQSVRAKVLNRVEHVSRLLSEARAGKIPDLK